MGSVAKRIVWLVVTLLVVGGLGQVHAQLICEPNDEGELICSGVETGGLNLAELAPGDIVVRLQDATVTNTAGDAAVYNLNDQTLYVEQNSVVFLEGEVDGSHGFTGIAAQGHDPGRIVIEGTVRVSGSAGYLYGVRLGAQSLGDEASSKTVTNKGTVLVHQQRTTGSPYVDGAAIAVFGTGNVIVNEGEIRFQDDSEAHAEPHLHPARGIYAAGGSLRIVNAPGGTIVTQGQNYAVGVETHAAAEVVIEQQGRVDVAGRQAVGMRLVGDGDADSHLHVTSAEGGTVSAQSRLE